MSVCLICLIFICVHFFPFSVNLCVPLQRRPGREHHFPRASGSRSKDDDRSVKLAFLVGCWYIKAVCQWTESSAMACQSGFLCHSLQYTFCTFGMYCRFVGGRIGDYLNLNCYSFQHSNCCTFCFSSQIETKLQEITKQTGILKLQDEVSNCGLIIIALLLRLRWFPFTN